MACDFILTPCWDRKPAPSSISVKTMPPPNEMHAGRRWMFSAIGVDSSRSALEVAERNAALNGHEVEWIEANAFDLLRDYADAGRQYDTIVLDPPAFARSKRDFETALRGYTGLNLR